MKLSLDQYAYLNSPIHRWELRYKLISGAFLTIAFAFVGQLVLIPVMILITIILYQLSGLPPSFVLSRLRYPGLFVLTVVILLPFTSGTTPLFDWGPIVVKQEGVLAAVKIVSRFVCILVLGIVIFATAPIHRTIKSLRSLGLSSIIVDMALLTYRYLEDLGNTLETMQRAMTLRGFNHHQFNRRNLNRIAGLVGTLLVRSYEQSQRVYHAMILRGYGQSTVIYHRPNSSHRYSLIASILAIATSVALLVAQFSLSYSN